MGDRRRGRRMVAGHDDRLDAGHAGRRQRLADAVAERVGEPDERSHLGRAVALAAGKADGPLPARRGTLDQDLPRRRRHARPAGFGEDGLRRADEERLDPAVTPGPGAGERTGIGDRLGIEELGGIEARRRPVLRHRPHQRAGERAGRRAATDRPGVLLRAERVAQDRRSVVGVLDRAGRGPDRGHVEPVAGQRPGLVGDDQVDRAEGLLRVEPAHEHAPLEEAVGTQAEDDREEDRRLLGDRGDRRRDAGEDRRACVLAPNEPQRHDDRDQPDRDPQEDPDEPVELGLQRRSPPTAIGQPTRDPAELGRGAGGDHDPLPSPADDARSAVGDRPPVGQVAVACIRLRATLLGDRFAGEDAAVELQAVDAEQAEVGRHDVAARQQDHVARDEARGGDLRRPSRSAGRGPSVRWHRGAPPAPARRGTR